MNDTWLKANGYLTKQEFLDSPIHVEEFKKDNCRLLNTAEESFRNYILNIGGALMMGIR